MQTPDHHTLNRFWSKALDGSLKEILIQVVLLLVEEGMLSLNEIYLDGTKIESVAGRYTFVWPRPLPTVKSEFLNNWKSLRSTARRLVKQKS